MHGHHERIHGVHRDRKRGAATGVRATVGFLCGCLALFAALASVPARADEALHGDFQFGLQGLSVDRERTARAFLYRDVPDDASLQALSLQWSDFGDGWTLDAAGQNVLRDDQRYHVGLSRPGLLRLKASWTETPHRFSNGATWLLSGAPGRFTLSGSLRQSLETAATDPAPPVPLATLTRDVLASTARRVEIELQRERADGSARLRVAPGLEIEATIGHEKRTGDRAISTGTYGRTGGAVAGEPNTGPNFFDRERFDVRGLELLEPIRHRVEEYGATARYNRAKGHAVVGWQGSFFRNKIGELLWENPFEAGPSVASSGDRGRFAQGGLDLAPENDYHRLHASGGLVLPRRTRVSAGVSYGILKQDDPFMAVTRNEALFFPGPDGTAGTADDIAGTSLSLLPATSLDGEIRTTSIDARVHSRPIPKLSLKGDFRNYKYEDRTASLDFPGYAAFGESAFRRGIGQRRAGADVLFNEVGGYERRVLSGGAGYDIVPRVGVDVEYRNTRWEYDTRQVESTTENAWTGRLRLRPASGVSAHASYTNGQRDFDGVYDVGFETSRVRAFDVWERDRQGYRFGVAWDPDPRWSLSADFADSRDEYPGVIAAPDPLPASGNIFASYPYGLNESKMQNTSATVGYHVERWNVYAAYGHETSDWSSLGVTKTSLTSDAIQYDPVNRWERQQDDTVDWASLGLNLRVVPDKLVLESDLGWSHYEGDFLTRNPATPNVNTGVAYTVPSFSSDFFSAKLGLRWSMRRDLELMARYWVEPYQLADWQWDNVQPYMQGVLKETAGAPDAFRDARASRYLFLDNRYSDYTLHAFALALAAHF